MTALLSLILVLCLSLVADSAKLREPLAAPTRSRCAIVADRLLIGVKPLGSPHYLQLGVGAVTKGSIARLLTLTQGNLLFLLNGKFHGRKACVLVGTVAKRLVVRIATGAIPIVTGL
jgi:hypothetical protein